MVKINEISDLELNQFSTPEDGKLSWDVVEDLMVYMRNEPDFYRRKVYPSFINIQETVKNGGRFNKRKLIPLIDEAIESYLKKYEIKKRPEDLMNDAEKMECINKLLKDEAENFRKGFY